MATSSMSTPVSQLQNTGNAPMRSSPNTERDVQDVISALHNEVSQPVITTTRVATFADSQPPQHYPPPPQYYQPPPPPHVQQNNYSEWLNTKDAQTAVIVAFIALCLLYPMDTSSIYQKFSFLSQLHQYDIFIRTLLLAVILYVLLRKFV
jgi:hypothetical protein